MADQKFADIHCHSTLYAFNRMRNSDEFEGDKSKFHPWYELPSRVDQAQEGKRAAKYTQCNFARLVEGEVDLVFLSYTPIEKGFFIGSAHGNERPLGKELLRWARGGVPVAAISRALGGDLDGAASELLGLLRNRGPLRQLVQQLVMNYSASRVRFLSSPEYDYWEELVAEYEFTKISDGEVVNVEIDTPQGPRQVEGSYRLISDSEALEESLATERQVATVLTIEGGHVLSVGPDLEILSKEVIKERIERIKSWDHPVLFLTLAHHFDNGICGQAHSLLDAANWIMDQSQGLDEGLDEERGLSTIRELLDLDEELHDRGGKRIAIDVRHMSAQSRLEYYTQVVRPYNAWLAEQPDEYRARYEPIPVIMSHGGYAAVATLDDLIDKAPKESDTWHREGYYSWNINACDEDIRVIHQSRGLMGLIFDRRLLGVTADQKIADEFWPDVVIRQIFAMVDVIMLDDRLDDEQKRRIWDCITLGTDFDGFIHPVEPYATALDLEQFAADLRDRLQERRHTRMIDEIGVDKLVDKICRTNVVDFARRHLPQAAGQRT